MHEAKNGFLAQTLLIADCRLAAVDLPLALS